LSQCLGWQDRYRKEATVAPQPNKASAAALLLLWEYHHHYHLLLFTTAIICYVNGFCLGFMMMISQRFL